MDKPEPHLLDSPTPEPSARPSTAWAADLTSGFLVSLIALPLCLGISMASNFPPMAGLITAIVGGLVATWISNSQLTIKGPAAGLIVIALGSVIDLGQGDLAAGYRLALGVGVVAGALQMTLGLLRLGTIGELFPTSAVHGMLVAIGVIIASKQAYVMLGVSPTSGEPLALLANLPHALLQLNPAVAAIGFASLALLFGLPAARHTWLRRVPAPIVVLLLSIAAGVGLRFAEPHSYEIFGASYILGPDLLVQIADSPLSIFAFPDFSALTSFAGWKYVLMFTLVGSLESLLSAKAIDLLDPQQRRCDLNRDLVAVGAANTLAALVGGLPMISEIVRSSANISNGAQTRRANFYHGLFLLAYVALLSPLMQMIPLAALAAMLVYTGCRLASIREWVHMAQVGSEQLAIFLTTLVVTLATDLLVGVGSGIALKIVIHLRSGVPLRAFLRPDLRIRQESESRHRIWVRDAAIFSNWLRLRQALEDHARPVVLLDLSHAVYVDHTALSKLEELRSELARSGRTLEILGLAQHSSLSTHQLAARRRVAA